MGGGIPHWLRRGAKVVAVATWSGRIKEGCGYGDEVGPIKGQVYTVRDAGDFHPDYPGEIQVLLEEIDNGRRRYRGAPEPFEVCFHISLFRPVTRISDSEEDGVEAQLMRSKGRSLRDATETREPFKEKA